MAAGPTISLLGCNERKDGHSATTASSKTNKVASNKAYGEKDVIFFNERSKVLHYSGLKKVSPTEQNKGRRVSLDEWERMVDGGEARFEKEDSGLIFERLALLNLRQNTDNASLEKSLQILSRSFSKDYQFQNRFNWRGYDLALKLIALNSGIGADEKWARFENITRDVNLGSVKIPPRNAWVRSKELFDQRVRYVNERQSEILSKINRRVA